MLISSGALIRPAAQPMSAPSLHSDTAKNYATAATDEIAIVEGWP
jgi:hypothetical protein